MEVSQKTGDNFSKIVKYCRSYNLSIIVRMAGFSRNIHSVTLTVYLNSKYSIKTPVEEQQILFLFSLNSNFFLFPFLLSGDLTEGVVDEYMEAHKSSY